jgi:hypothetical protein
MESKFLIFVHQHVDHLVSDGALKILEMRRMPCIMLIIIKNQTNGATVMHMYTYEPSSSSSHIDEGVKRTEEGKKKQRIIN